MTGEPGLFVDGVKMGCFVLPPGLAVDHIQHAGGNHIAKWFGKVHAEL